jgi:hypothetical protein
MPEGPHSSNEPISLAHPDTEKWDFNYGEVVIAEEMDSPSLHIFPQQSTDHYSSEEYRRIHKMEEIESEQLGRSHSLDRDNSETGLSENVARMFDFHGDETRGAAEVSIERGLGRGDQSQPFTENNGRYSKPRMSENENRNSSSIGDGSGGGRCNSSSSNRSTNSGSGSGNCSVSSNDSSSNVYSRCDGSSSPSANHGPEPHSNNHREAEWWAVFTKLDASNRGSLLLAMLESELQRDPLLARKLGLPTNVAKTPPLSREEGEPSNPSSTSIR